MNDDLVRTVEDLRRELEDLKTQVIQPAAVAARVYRSTDQSIPHSTFAAISFSAARDDDGGFWDAGNPTRLSIPENGWYSISYTVSFGVSPAGARIVRVDLNGTTVISREINYPLPGTYTEAVGATTYKLSAGDYVELVAWQNSGGDLDINSSGNFSPEFSIAKIV